MYKKLLAMIITLFIITAIMPATVFAVEYNDINNHWANSEIVKWSKIGIIQGSDGRFRPNDAVTRGEMAVIIDRIMKFDKPSENSFTDLDENFYTKSLLGANSAGIIVGENGIIRPKDKLTREEATVIIGRALGVQRSNTSTFSDTREISDWAKGYVFGMAEKGYITGMGENNFEPKSYVSRAQVVKLLDNSIKAIYNNKAEYSGEVDGTAIVNTSDVVLKNSIIKGDLIVSQGVGDGSVVLDNTKVVGKTLIRSGEVQLAVPKISIPNINKSTNDSNKQTTQTDTSNNKQSSTVNNDEQMKAVWISFLEYGGNDGREPLIMGKPIEQAKQNIENIFDNVKSAGLNTVVVHVRSHSDAIYKSEIFPSSIYVNPNGSSNRRQGDDIGWDVLEFMVEEAHSRGLKIHAWFNPYRIGVSDKNKLSETNPARKWIEDIESGRISERFVVKNDVYAYNPAYEEVMDLIADGVREVAENYDVDGIHFDDYFYPTKGTSFDSVEYNAYKSAGGDLDLGTWRLNNVSKLIKKVYNVVHSGKAKNKNIVFGVSPQGSINGNYQSQYADVALWTSEDGYIDYIVPQIYYGFKNTNNPFEQTIDKWSDMVTNDKVKLYVGLAAYKVGKYDKWAGKTQSTQLEWVNDEEILKRMLDKMNSTPKVNGFILFSYDTIFRPSGDVQDKVNREMEAFRGAIK